MYRVGYPGWKLAAKWGVPVLVRVQVVFDEETKSYWAKSQDLDGLVVSGANLDELRAEVVSAAGLLISLAVRSKNARAKTEMRILDNAVCAA